MIPTNEPLNDGVAGQGDGSDLPLNDGVAKQGDGSDGKNENDGTGGITPITPMPPIESNGNDGTPPPDVVTPPEVVMPPVEVEMELRKIASEVAYACGMATGNAHDLLTGQGRAPLSPERRDKIAELALSDTPGRHALIREIIVEHNCECSAKDIRDAKPRVEKG